MKLSALVALSAVLSADARITAFHVDDESCSGLIQDNRTAQIISCNRFFTSLVNLSSALEASKSLPAPLRLSVDAGTGWVCQTGATNCFNLTFNGTTKSVAQHVVDLADEVVLMDYDTSAAKVLSRARPYLEYADARGKRASVVVGLAVAAWNATPAWWQVRTEDELAKLMQDAAPALDAFTSFGGYAVFTDGTWLSHAAHGAAPTYLRRTGTWYIDHAPLIDTNTTRRDAWLAWARARNVSEVYIAPHAGADALISIPGVEGSPENDKRFCDFVWLAERQGLSVQLLSDPATDMKFIRNCSARATVQW